MRSSVILGLLALSGCAAGSAPPVALTGPLAVVPAPPQSSPQATSPASSPSPPSPASPSTSPASPPPPAPDVSGDVAADGPPDARVDLPWRELDGADADGPALAPGVVLAAVPRRARAQLDPQDIVARATALGPSGRRFLARQRWGVVESTLLVVDADGRVVAAKHFDERAPRVGLVDLLGDDELEVVVEVIEGTALSSYPKSWRIHRVDREGRLREVGRLAESYATGSKRLTFYFDNHVTMPQKGVLRVETALFSEPGPSPPAGAPERAGEVYELRWDARRNIFRRDRP